ncbi:hypothetical protein GPALN_014394 [Globodera pallida]|nr:hypothetical protein GPALN_014394 [Globodera pallida]
MPDLDTKHPSPDTHLLSTDMAKAMTSECPHLHTPNPLKLFDCMDEFTCFSIGEYKGAEIKLPLQCVRHKRHNAGQRVLLQRCIGQLRYPKCCRTTLKDRGKLY